MSFQLANADDLNKCIKQGKLSTFGLTLYTDKEVSVRINSNESDELLLYAEEYEELIRETERAVNVIHFRSSNVNNRFLLMKPLSLYHDGKKYNCPLFMYISHTGMGMLKLSVPLINVDADSFITTPNYDFYNSFCFYDDNDNSDCSSYNETNRESFNSLMYIIIQTSFEGFLLSGYKQLCFETILLLDTFEPDINKKQKTDEINKGLYNLAYPESFLDEVDKRKLELFELNNVEEYVGLKFVKCFPSRMIIYGNPDKIKILYGRGEETNSLEYFENTIHISYDWSICIAIWKRMNQLTFLDTSTLELQQYNSHKAFFNKIENELDSMLDLVQLHTRSVFYIVYENMGQAMYTINERIARVGEIESIIRDRYNARRGLIIDFIVLVCTLIFGLPTIRETVSIIKISFFNNSTELSRFISINGISITVWLILSVCAVLFFWKNYKDYISYHYK